MANRVFSISRFRESAGNAKAIGISPVVNSGKSSRGRLCNANEDLPANNCSLLPVSSSESSTCAPSGSLRTISYIMCAGAVMAPASETSASTFSRISISRSVAVMIKLPFSAAIITFDKIDGVASFNDTLHMIKGFQKGRYVRWLLSFFSTFQSCCCQHPIRPIFAFQVSNTWLDETASDNESLLKIYHQREKKAHIWCIFHPQIVRHRVKKTSSAHCLKKPTINRPNCAAAGQHPRRWTDPIRAAPRPF